MCGRAHKLDTGHLEKRFGGHSLLNKDGGLGGRPTPVLARRCMMVRDGHAMMRKPLSPRRGVFFGCKTVDAKRQQTISEYSNFPIRNGPVILRSGRGCKHHMIL
jgi:hypothetical protein